ncbi:FkbM family methyltransferase [Marinobacter sp. M3C]|jgi:FkbM family methyltransferase|uniref:FkbM family methyltransferase n=1 Tax=Marinobacter sp. M3C TaxID=2917715 RepID=UPI00200E4E1B|nr:FkbM family methyltransferase [Marinobacter sp. M3C]MCL1477303.1 FkbM family methyltransferase [Marinobacter sp.]UQG61797.1 FkbM family methyltransferase [Marinobacter sp. M3C]
MKFYSISYFKFFVRKFCNLILKKSELSISQRNDMLFISPNDKIGSVIQSHGYYEKEFLICIKVLVEHLSISNKLAVDVGANIGNHTLYFSHLFDSVVAFEPSLSLNLVLQANLIRNKRKNVEVIRCGLGETNGNAFIKELSREHTGMVELEIFSGDSEGLVEAVEVNRGDDLLFDRLLPIGFIKVDVEGMEVSVFKGMKECISRDKPLIAFEARNIVEGNQAIQWLSDVGYSYFYEVFASRIGAGKYLDVRSLFALRKSYMLRKIERLENKHYSAIFASVDEIVF